MTPLQQMILALADDELVMGHRASEWTGLGPLLEADLALSSMAQDEMGHALLLYRLLEPDLGDADDLIYTRPAPEWRNAILCERPRTDWGETLMRHYLYDLAEQIRYEALADSSEAPLAAVARKIRPEERYHLLHGTTWIGRLVRGSDESRRRMQEALDTLLPYALGLFEPFADEAALVAAGVTPPSSDLAARWLQALTAALGDALSLPAHGAIEPVTGGRTGRHTPAMTQLLDAMQHLHREMPGVQW